MNPFVIHYVSGWAFFVGLLLIALGVGMSLCPWWFVRSYLARIICIAGGLNIFFSAAPLPYSLLSMMYTVLAVQILAGGSEKLKFKIRLLIGGLLTVFLLIAFFAELPYWVSPKPVQMKSNRIVVLGDSISAGIGFNGEKTWTDILREKHRYIVANKSVGGGTVPTAINSLTKAKVGKDDLIIIEIGGNDFFKGTRAKNFHKNLDELLAKAKKRTPLVIMLELPLPFLKVSFGRSQRELAAKHKVVLIPKRNFSHVFNGFESTVDGLHLTNHGHEKMAKMITDHITPAR